MLSWVNPVKLSAYYQIDTISSKASRYGIDDGLDIKVQWHHLTPLSSNEPSVNYSKTAIVQQRLATLKSEQRKLQQAGQLSRY